MDLVKQEWKNLPDRHVQEALKQQSFPQQQQLSMFPYFIITRSDWRNRLLLPRSRYLRFLSTAALQSTFAHSYTHLLTHSHTHALTHSHTHALTHSHTHALAPVWLGNVIFELQQARGEQEANGNTSSPKLWQVKKASGKYRRSVTYGRNAAADINAQVVVYSQLIISSPYIIYNLYKQVLPSVGVS